MPNWKQIGIECEGMSIPEHIRDDFEATGDTNAFRAAARKFGASEEAIDWAITEIERWK